jgi:hypothetical protein
MVSTAEENKTGEGGRRCRREGGSQSRMVREALLRK